MADGTWFATHDQFFSHPKVRRAGRDAALLFQAGKAYCSRHLTDGVIPAEVLDVIAAEAWTTKKATGPLLREGLWHDAGHDCPRCPPCPEGHYLVHDYLDWNRSKDEAEESKQKRASAGAVGNHRRWHVDRGVVDPDCEHCQASQTDPDPPPKRDRNAIASAIPKRSHNGRKPVAQSQSQDSLEQSSQRARTTARTRGDGRTPRSGPQSASVDLDDPSADPDAKTLRAIELATEGEVQRAVDNGKTTTPDRLRGHVRQRNLDEHHLRLLGLARQGWTARDLAARIENPSHRPRPRAVGGAA